MSAFKLAYLIDDDPIYQFGMRILLREIDFGEEIRFFQNGQEAMDSVHETLELGENLPEVVFLDLDMPVMDGWEVLDALLQLRPNSYWPFKVYVISSSINPSDRQRALDYEVVKDYLVKPINAEGLERIIQELKNPS